MNNQPILKIDNDFKNLIRPLVRKEYLQLEENILADGCLTPIVIWNGYILDGHNRYEICTKHNIPFEVEELDFLYKEEAIAWICRNQLGRRNISDEQRKYLIGAQYEAEKIANRYKNRYGVNQYNNDENKPKTESSSAPKNKTATKIADENHITHATVQKYAAFSRALNGLKITNPDFVIKVLDGKYKISHENIVELSKMPTVEVKKIENQMARQHKPFIHYNQTRNAITPEPQHANNKPYTPSRPSVKDMPKYDPNAPLIELSLTIPSWTSSIKRISENIDTSTTSATSKQKLVTTLNDLDTHIIELITILTEN